MKKLFAAFFFFLSISSLSSQSLIKNETTKKYEMDFELTSTKDDSNYNFNVIEEWLMETYTHKQSSMKYSNKEKAKINFNAAFETKIFPAKGLISFTYTINLDKSKVKIHITDFAYTIIGQSLGAGSEMPFEDKLLGGKKKIIAETELKIKEAVAKIKF